MKKLLKKIGLFAVTFIALCLLYAVFQCVVVSNQYEGSYVASINDKIERLQSIDEPKIILAGNSNLAFGIDSSMIEEEIGMPVVNLGLHGGLGNAFHENMVKLGLNEGDIVIVCDNNYTQSEILDYDLAWITIEWHFELWSILRPEDWWEMVKAFPRYCAKATSQWLNGTGNKLPGGRYSRDAFNEYGDNAFDRTENHYTFGTTPAIPLKVNDESINRLNNLNEYIESKGATMLVAAYQVGYNTNIPSAEAFKKFGTDLDEKLNAKVISDFSDYFFSQEYFYDTNLHLTNDGVKLRTEQLIKDIKGYLETKE